MLASQHDVGYEKEAVMITYHVLPCVFCEMLKDCHIYIP